MIPKGGREAMGGAVGDTYTLYAGMEAVSLEDLDSLFNDAEVRSIRLAFFPYLILFTGFNDSPRGYTHPGLWNIHGAP